MTQPNPATNQDHRTRVAAEKRERMRMRLIDSALLVFARKGADAAVIDDVIRIAAVSRGTFYNYFRTNDELVAALVQELGRELLALVDAHVLYVEDPAQRLAQGVRIVLHTMRKHLLLARFVSKVGLATSMEFGMATDYLVRDILAAAKAKRFSLQSAHTGFVLVMGSTHAAICALALDPSLPDHFPENITYHLLLGLGLNQADARSFVNEPIAAIEFPPDALLSRTQHTLFDLDA